MDLHNARKTYGMLKGCIRNDAGFNLPRVTTIKWSLMGGLPNYFPEEYMNQMFEVETPFLLGGTEREVIIRTLDGNIFLISESDIEILLTLEDVAVELAYIVTPPPKPKKKEYIATTPPRPLAKKARRKKATPKMESKSKGKGSPFPFDM